LVLNFEARGDRGPSLLFETSNNNAALIQEVAHAAPYPVGSSLFYSLYKLLPNDTDFTVFRPAATPGLNFAFGGRLEAYHCGLARNPDCHPCSSGCCGMAAFRTAPGRGDNRRHISKLLGTDRIRFACSRHWMCAIRDVSQALQHSGTGPCRAYYRVYR